MSTVKQKGLKWVWGQRLGVQGQGPPTLSCGTLRELLNLSECPHL